MILCILPAVGALLGWLANYLAVKMLFHPRRERRFVFMRMQGVFPRRQNELAERMGSLVAAELFSFEDLKQALRDKAHAPETASIIEFHIEQALMQRLAGLMPFLPPKVTEALLAKVKGLLRNEMRVVVDDVVRNLSDELEASLDVNRMVQEKVGALTSEKLETLLFSMLRSEFVFIQWAGAAVGALVGAAALVFVLLLK